MKRYAVTVARTELITFELDADSEQDARDRYLSDGDETDSKTTDLSVVEVREVS